MDEKRKRFVARMVELERSASEVERIGHLKSGAVRDYLGRKDGRPGNEPSIERAVALANGVDWTLEQFFHKVDKIQLKLRLDGVTKGQGMWSSIERGKPEVIPLTIPTEGLVAIKISHEGEVPQLGFRAGDTIIGNKSLGPNFGNLISTECMICTEDDRKLLGVLHPGSKKTLFNVQPLNPLLPPITDVKIAWVAPITLIIRGH
jgi:hypothetical protein